MSYTSDLTYGCTVTADSYYSGYPPSRLVDDIWSTEFLSGTGVFPHWVYVDFGSGITKTISQYTIRSTTFMWERCPKNFKLQGSNNTSDWTDIDTQTNQTWTAGLQIKTFNSFSNSTPYRYYRIYVTASNYGDNFLQFGELEMMEVVAETATISENLSLNDSWSENITPDNQSVADSLSLDDLWVLQPNPDNQSLLDSLSLDDLWNIHISAEELFIDESISLDDSWSAQVNPESQSISDTLSLDDSWTEFITPESQVLNDSLSLSDNWLENVFGTYHIHLFTDLRWLSTTINSISSSLNWLIGKSINTDFRWLGISQKPINTDFRWLTNSYTILNPIAQTDVQIFINGTDILLGNDIDIETGNIIHTIGQNSQASFTLARRHDDLDRTHAGIASQITNQNPVQIYIDGHLEFDGYIMTINVDSEIETVTITAQMEQPSDNRHSIELPLPSVNEKLHLYHCLVNNVQIDNPKEDTRAVIIGSNNKYWNGSSWVFYIEDAMVFTTDIDAQAYIDNYVDVSVNLIFDSKQPSVTSREKNPQYYKGVKVNLGTKIVQQVDRFMLPDTIGIDGKGENATKIENGTFIFQPNFTYFWAVSAKNIRTGQENWIEQYIGTSLASTTTDLWVLKGVTPFYQKIKDNLETELGYYYIGTAPFKEISTKNGQLITTNKWKDKSNGLYSILEASYNYAPYAKLVADLEYQKLLSVHGDVLPITSASLDVTFDAYYYYNIKLLTRINVTNTTVINTYNNLNGFPISVKSININFKSMKISLTTDNKLSQVELDEFDAQMPDEESDLYVVSEKEILILRKFDLRTWKYVS